MKLITYLLLDLVTHGIWPFLLNLPFAVMGYLVVHTCAKYIETHFKGWVKDVDPLIKQPFHHYYHHTGSLDDCHEGLCETL